MYFRNFIVFSEKRAKTYDKLALLIIDNFVYVLMTFKQNLVALLFVAFDISQFFVLKLKWLSKSARKNFPQK